MEIKQGELVLCEFYFSDLEGSKQRPVIVFKDNLPFNDFVGIPVSSKINKLHVDESLLEPEELQGLAKSLEGYGQEDVCHLQERHCQEVRHSDASAL